MSEYVDDRGLVLIRDDMSFELKEKISLYNLIGNIDVFEDDIDIITSRKEECFLKEDNYEDLVVTQEELENLFK